MRGIRLLLGQFLFEFGRCSDLLRSDNRHQSSAAFRSVSPETLSSSPIGSMAATRTDRDDLDRVGNSVVGGEAVDDPKALRSDTRDIESDPQTAGQIARNVTFSERLADLGVVGKVRNGLERYVYQHLVEHCESANVVKHLGQKYSVVAAAAHRVGLAVVGRVTIQRLSGIIETKACPRIPVEPALSFGSIEAVFYGGEDLEPQIPADDHTLGVPVTPESYRLSVHAIAFERRDDLRELRPRFGSREHRPWSSDGHARIIP